MSNPFDILEHKLNKLDEIVNEIKEQNDKVIGIANDQKGVAPLVVGVDKLIELFPIFKNARVIQRLAQERKIPHSKKLRKLVFDTDEVKRWLLEDKQKTIAQQVDEIIG